MSGVKNATRFKGIKNIDKNSFTTILWRYIIIINSSVNVPIQGWSPGDIMCSGDNSCNN